MCKDIGVYIILLSPYSPNFNLIKENFYNLKEFIRKK